jgi:nitroreductase
MEAIYKRRSIRKYTGQAVPGEDMEELLRAAMSAPSAGNEQPWHFVVIDDRGLLDQVPRIHPYAQALKSAPVAILVCGDPDLEARRGWGYWMLDCAAATENLLLAVAAKGLGAVWLGIYPDKERVEGMSRLLDLPPNIVPFALVPVGYPAEQKPREDRYRKERVHYNRW